MLQAPVMEIHNQGVQLARKKKTERANTNFRGVAGALTRRHLPSVS